MGPCGTRMLEEIPTGSLQFVQSYLSFKTLVSVPLSFAKDIEISGFFFCSRQRAYVRLFF
jgi:hypothetical protein